MAFIRLLTLIWYKKMAKYLKPKLKMCRREETDLGYTSGKKPLDKKCKFYTKPSQSYKKKNIPLSDYGIRLREKQKIKRIYGILEKQFLNYYKKSVKLKGNTGEHLLRFLELRLDNIIYRLGWANTRAEARQLINHKAINVNNVTVNIPSYQVLINDSIQINYKSKNKKRINLSRDLNKLRYTCPWLQNFNKESKLIRLPYRNEFNLDFKEHLIVELYSR